MAAESTGTARRLLRAALAAGVLAVGWLAVDLITHTEPAAAAETIDAPDLLGVVGGTLDAVTLPAIPVIDTVIEPVMTTVVAPVTAPVVTSVVTPLQPLITSVTNPAVDGVVRVTTPLAPVLEPLAPVVSQVLTPVATNILAPLAPSIAAVAPPLVELAAIVAAQLPQLGVSSLPGVLVVGGGLVLAAVIGASPAPLLPGPVNGGPRNAPTPAPSSSTGTFAFFADLAFTVPSVLATRVSTVAPSIELPVAPTFAFDTTPD